MRYLLWIYGGREDGVMGSLAALADFALGSSGA
jgi:hypothetical protein